MTSFDELFGADTIEDQIELNLERIALAFQFALQAEMEKKCVSKADLAMKMGVSPARVSQMLSGHANNLTLKSIAKIATALKVEFEVVERSNYLAAMEAIRNKRAPIRNQKSREIVRSRGFWHDHTANENKFPTSVAA